ncbi:hypothetical protein HDIA_1209 [Hartmannibacter diazotrophicus]|uniref:Glycosyltransferase RgtA/B/C/D-like domain-containing protein n=1 Tax=Hartmannibacter diazotrophicus TaxID=1482074 RepID=A0A2C9D3A8_9HYPH|nr:hypothetical protein [Hartmannibacter diazotrophicus]SON54750.1 hypothetical protein HDIA_1209 [Hartmannibacter diazotrophicus]
MSRKFENFYVNVAMGTLFACLVIAISIDPKVHGYDDGIILTGADRVLRGEVPYRDFWSMYGPATYYFNAAVLELFDNSAIAVKITALLFKVLIVVFGFVIISKANGPKWAFLGAVCLLGLLIKLGFDLFTVYHATALILVAFMMISSAEPTRIRMLGAGLLTGFAALFRHDMGFYACLTAALALMVFAFGEGTGLRARLGKAALQIAIFAAGVGLVFFPALIVLLKAAGVQDVVFNLITAPSAIYPAARGLPWPFPWDSAVYIPLLGIPILAAIGLGLAQHSETSEQSFADRMLITLSLAAVVFMAKGAVRVESLHMAPALVFAFLALFTYRGAYWRENRRALVMTVLVIGGISYSALYAATGFRNSASNVMKIARAEHPFQALDCLTRIGEDRVACLEIPARYQQAVAFIKENTTQDDLIYVGPKHHDKVFANYLAFYFFADRRSPTKWEETHPGIQTSPEVQMAMIIDFTARPPKYILLDAAWGDIHEPNQSSRSSGVFALDNFIRDHYRKVTSYGSLDVWAENS